MESNPQSGHAGYAPPTGYDRPTGRGPGDIDGSDAPGATPAKPGKIGPGRTRAGLVALFAFLLELVAIAGYGNQGVTDHVINNLRGDSFTSRLYIAGQTYSWRFTPPDSDTGHRWLAQLLLPVSFLVLSTLLILVVVRGSVTLFRAFFATWGVVLLSTVAAAYVRGAVAAPASPSGSGSVSKADSLLFYNGPNAYVVLAGAGVGFVVALVVAIVTAATRRPAPVALPPGLVAVEPAALPDPDQPPPYFGVSDPTDRSRPLYGDRDHDRPQPGAYLFEKQDDDTTAVPVSERAQHAALDGEASAERTSRLPVIDDAVPARRVEADSRPEPAYDRPRDDADERTTRLPVVDGPATAAEPAAAEPASPATSAHETAATEPSHAVPASEPSNAVPASEPTHAVPAAEPTHAVPAAEPTSAAAEPSHAEPVAPAAESGDGATTQLPRVTEPERDAASPAAPDEHPTTQFPRPPDDDDLHGDPDLHR